MIQLGMATSIGTITHARVSHEMADFASGARASGLARIGGNRDAALPEIGVFGTAKAGLGSEVGLRAIGGFVAGGDEQAFGKYFQHGDLLSGRG